MVNREIRIYLMEHNIRHFELAKKIGLSETTLYRRLREELPTEEKDRFISALIEIAKEKEEK